MTQNQAGEEVGKLFVGGLSWETTQENLHNYFCRFGEVVDCVVMRNNETGRSRGFGFVTFKDPSCVTLVLASGPHELDGRTIDPKSCNPRSMQKAASKTERSTKKGTNYPKIFLGGLPSAVTETDLRTFFSKYGKVMEVVIMFDQERKKSRGFGFLSFETEDSVERVCAEHYVTINGKQVECKRAEPREGRPPKDQNSQWGAQSWGAPPGAGVPSQPMGAPMANGMMAPGYQGAWPPPPQQAPFPPQGPWPAQTPPGSEFVPPAGYQPWPGAPAGFSPYGAPGAQQYAQPYPGYGYPGFPGAQPPPAPGTDTFQPPPPPPPPQQQQSPSGPPGTQAPPPASTAPKTDFNYNTPFPGTLGTYQQDSASYGPVRAGYGDTYSAGNQAYNSSNNTADGGNRPGQSQGYHPYRR